MKRLVKFLAVFVSVNAFAAEIKVEPLRNPEDIFEHVRKDPRHIYIAKLVGPMEVKVREAVNNSGDVLVIGTEQKRFSDVCSQYGLGILAKGTPTKEGKPVDWLTKYEYKHCTDGSTPGLGLNPAVLEAFLSKQQRK